MNDRLGVRRSLAACGAMAVWSFGCGGAPPPPPAPSAAAAPTAPAAIAAKPDLSEAPEPNLLVGIIRWKNPSTTFDTIYRWTGFRLSAESLAAEATDKSLASTLAFDAPVDVAVALDPKSTERDPTPFAAFAVGVKSMEEARRALEPLATVIEHGPGAYKVNFRHPRKKSVHATCVLGVAPGPTPGRFVCARRDRDLDALSAYLMRSAPRKDYGTADLHVEARMPPVMKQYGPTISQGLRIGAALAPRKLEIGEPTFDRALGRAAVAISEELGALANDVDGVVIDLSMAPEKADASVALRLKDRQSWTAGTIADTASRANAPPPMFWRLPADATMATYQYESSTKRYEAIKHTVGEMVDGLLAHEGIAEADRAGLTALFSEKYASDGVWVSAAGAFAADPPAKSSAKANAPEADPLPSLIARSGWYIAGVTAPNKVAEVLKDLSTAISRPKIQAFAKKKISELIGDTGGERLVPLSGNFPAGFAMKSVPPPAELPKGSLDFELTVMRQSFAAPAGEAAKSDANKGAASKAKTKKIPLAPVKLHLLVLPEAAQTWIALGGDRAKLAKELAIVVAGAPEAGTLASRGDIAPMKSGKFVSASFFTVESFATSWLGALGTALRGTEGGKSPDPRALLETTPNKGKTPIFLTAEVSNGDALTSTIRMDVPKGVIEDVILLGASQALGAIVLP
ncbi:MAG TPA: hypothetical protein VJT73_18365 [Polyangiaceae bacterium]|nr:hypothetical protein [Polyangiaceae bacterium]